MSYDLTAITDNGMRADLQRLYDIVLTAEAWNHPQTSSDSAGGAGKPESRPPGVQQARGHVTRVKRELRALVSALQTRQEQSTVREARPVEVQSVGGIPTDIPESMTVDLSIGPHVRRVRADVTAGRLAAKYI